MEQLFPDLSAEERAKRIRSLCDEPVDDFAYTVEIGEEELTELSLKHSELSVKLAKAEAAEKDRAQRAKLEIKKIKMEVTPLIEKLRDKVEHYEGEAYIFRDQENGVANYYNLQGRLIHSRPLTLKERQTTLQYLTRGTSDDFKLSAS